MPFKNKEDYNAYMREYLRKRRNALKDNPNKNIIHNPIDQSLKDENSFIIIKKIDPDRIYSIRFLAWIGEFLKIIGASNMSKKQLKFAISKRILQV